jgi:hypothetical protein
VLCAEVEDRYLQLREGKLIRPEAPSVGFLRQSAGILLLDNRRVRQIRGDCLVRVGLELKLVRKQCVDAKCDCSCEAEGLENNRNDSLDRLVWSLSSSALSCVVVHIKQIVH